MLRSTARWPCNLSGHRSIKPAATSNMRRASFRKRSPITSGTLQMAMMRTRSRQPSIISVRPLLMQKSNNAHRPRPRPIGRRRSSAMPKPSDRPRLPDRWPRPSRLSYGSSSTPPDATLKRRVARQQRQKLSQSRSSHSSIRRPKLPNRRSRRTRSPKTKLLSLTRALESFKRRLKLSKARLPSRNGSSLKRVATSKRSTQR